MLKKNPSYNSQNMQQVSHKNQSPHLLHATCFVNTDSPFLNANTKFGQFVPKIAGYGLQFQPSCCFPPEATCVSANEARISSLYNTANSTCSLIFNLAQFCFVFSPGDEFVSSPALKVKISCA